MSDIYAILRDFKISDLHLCSLWISWRLGGQLSKASPPFGSTSEVNQRVNAIPEPKGLTLADLGLAGLIGYACLR